MTKQDSFQNYRQYYPDGHKSNHTWGGRLEKIAKTIPNKVAFIQGERKLTWKEFNRRTNRLANALLELGVKKEDRVAIMGFNSIEWTESYFGISKIGAVPVNVTPRFLSNELKYILEGSDSVALIAENDNLGRIEEIRQELPLLEHVIVIGERIPEDMIGYEKLLARSFEKKVLAPWKVTNEDFSFLFYTGGTTGYPKGTVWDNYGRVQGLDSILITGMAPLGKKLPNLPSDAIQGLNDLLPIPLSERFVRSKFFHWLVNREPKSDFSGRLSLRLHGSRLAYYLAGGKAKLVVAAQLFHGTAYEANLSMIGAFGATSIYLTQRQPFDPRELWETVERNQANLIVIVGDAFAIPMAEELHRKNYDIRSLFAIVSSGVRWSPGVKKKLLQKHPGLLLIDELGSTETSSAYSQISSSVDEDISLLRIKIVPKGINSTRVINPETKEDVKPGERGELVFGGFNSLGYWKDPERTANHYRVIDGRRWFYVGDEGTVDDAGYFHFIGRGSSIINSGGEKVYAEEVEETLMQHRHIREAGVTGVPDERWGEAVTAVIQPEKGADLTPEEIIEYCRAKMAGYKKPKHVLFVESLPRAASGKLERKGLREMAAKLVAGSR